MTEFTAIALGYYLPYVVASLLALLAISRPARRLVWAYSAAVLPVLSVVLFLSAGCQTQELMLRDCPNVGLALEFPPSLATRWLLPIHFLLSPILAMVAVVIEWRTRKALRR